MAIARLSATTQTYTDSVYTLTVSHDAGTAANRVLAMGAWDQGGPTYRITGLTFNAESATSIVHNFDHATLEYGCNELFLLGVGLDTGIHDIVLTRSSNDANGMTIEGAVYAGANQSNSPNVFSSAKGTSVTSLTFDYTTTVDACWAFSNGRTTGGSVTGGTNFTVFSGGSGGRAGDSNASLGSAGSKTIQCSYTSGNCTLTSMALAPAPAAAASTGFFFNV